MKVLLAIPTVNYATLYPSFLSISDFPTGFAYIASALKSAGHEVVGLNPNNDPHHGSAREMLADKLLKALTTSAPDLIGLGGLCTDFIFLKDCIALIRTISPRTPIVLGGRIVTHDTEYVFQKLRPDYCIVGEGEEVICRLAGMLEQGRATFQDIDNLGYWDNGLPRFTRRNYTYPDLDSRPFPDYEPFGIRDMMDNYSSATRWFYRYPRLLTRTISIVTARGCPFSCTFCIHDKHRGYRARSIENIVKELVHLHEKYNFNVLILLDELFAVNKQRVHEFVNAVMEGKKKYGWDFNWLFQTHASASLDGETLAAAKQAGCYMFSYGLESASPTVLASMNKKTKHGQIIEAIRLADQAQIGFGGNFIFGDVAETTRTIGETLDFFSAHCTSNHIFFGCIQPYPGSKLFDHCMEKGIIKDKDAYYESGCAIVQNMTSLSDYVWYPWMHEMLVLGSQAGWTRPATASDVTVEDTQDIIAQYYRQKMVSFKIICPHCGQGSSYRDLLSTGSQSATKVRLIDLLKEKVHFAVRLWRQGVFLRHLRFYGVALVIKPFLFRFNPAFKKLSYLRVKDPDGRQSLIRGCKNCHKQIRIMLP